MEHEHDGVIVGDHQIVVGPESGEFGIVCEANPDYQGATVILETATGPAVPEVSRAETDVMGNVRGWITNAEVTENPANP